jgi:SAM-dependent methyltransferase
VTNGWRAELRPCPICGADDARVLGARGGRAHRAGAGVETTIVGCRTCHGVYQRPTLLPQMNPYADHSADEYFHGHDSTARIAFGGQFAAYAERVLGGPGRMLELGCGRGELLRGAANRGWEVRGVEMTESFVRIARASGIAVECAPVEMAKMLDDRHDVVLMSAILEHLYEPAATLRRVRDALRPGGLVYIDVPNECSLMTRLGNAYLRARGTDWVMNLSPTFPPFHVVGFCPASLRHILRANGFRPLSLRFYRMVDLLAPARGLRAAVERAGLEAAVALGRLIGMGAGMLCWAVRE